MFSASHLLNISTLKPRQTLSTKQKPSPIFQTSNSLLAPRATPLRALWRKTAPSANTKWASRNRFHPKRAQPKFHHLEGSRTWPVLSIKRRNPTRNCYKISSRSQLHPQLSRESASILATKLLLHLKLKTPSVSNPTSLLKKITTIRMFYLLKKMVFITISGRGSCQSMKRASDRGKIQENS
jgi:hypothetical protein